MDYIKKNILIALFLLATSFQALAGDDLRGDVNGDGLVDASDVVALIDYVLNGAWGDEVIMANGVAFRMIRVDSGVFMMGAASDDEQASERERPTHQVTLTGYYIGQTEVTQELWLAVMGYNPSDFNDDPQRPVDYVSWEECQEFISKLNELTGRNFRLPSEAEWEFAARGGNKSKGYLYSGSDNVDEVAWYEGNSYDLGMGNPDFGPHAVMTKSPNELGIYDMSGNVMEWCQDWSGDYSAQAQTDPTGPSIGSVRVTRGGSWGGAAVACRVTYRGGAMPSSRGHYRGFRLAM